MATRTGHLGRRQGVLIGFLSVLLWAGWLIPAVLPASRETYTYVDDQGTVVFTDDLQNTEPRYRQRAKLVQGASRAETPLVTVDGLSLRDSTNRFTFGGLTPYQSRTLIIGFCTAIVMLMVMGLTSNPAIRLLMRWLLILLTIGTTASIYFSNDPLTAKATIRARELEQRQQDKAQQLERMEPGAEEPVR